MVYDMKYMLLKGVFNFNTEIEDISSRITRLQAYQDLVNDFEDDGMFSVQRINSHKINLYKLHNP